MNPNEIDARIDLGALLFDLDRQEEAMKVFDEAIALAPNDAIVYHNKGLALQQSRRNEEAI